MVTKIAARIAAAGLTQAEVIERTGLSRGVLTNCCTGRGVPAPDSAAKLAAVLGVPVGVIFAEAVSDRWTMGSCGPSAGLFADQKSPAVVTVNALREMSRSSELSPAFRDKVEGLGDELVEALVAELT